jgi:hypothetical protein
MLAYLAATSPAVATGFWDGKPRATPGRLRRVLLQAPFLEDAGFPGRMRNKGSATEHLPKGVVGHRRQRRGTPARQPLPLAA